MPLKQFDDDDKKISAEFDINLKMLDDFSSRLHDNKGKIGKFSRMIELSLILVGTILWGYGDLLIN